MIIERPDTCGGCENTVLPSKQSLSELMYISVLLWFKGVTNKPG
jgi:hypothetical protein